jgi:hypothetical protein
MALSKKIVGDKVVWAARRSTGRFESYLPVLNELVDKYEAILGCEHVRPHLSVADNLGSDWLGITELSLRDMTTTTITVQASILDDPVTLERVIAHEMVHHWEFMNMDAADLVRLKMGIKPPSHGESFHRGAAIVNAVMGEGFVTVASDKTYVRRKNTRPFYLLIVPTRHYVGIRNSQTMPFGYAWAVRITPQNREKIDSVLAEGGKLVRITDDRFTSGVKIERWGKITVPEPGSEQAVELARLFETEPGITPP